MRSNVWDDALRELADSIKQYGLLQPITLRRKGERYEVIAGHRRLAAFRMNGFPLIDSIVRQADDIQSDAMKVHENLFRADVNPVDQADFLARYIKSSGLDVSEVARVLNRSVEWVERRLEISSYAAYIKDALRVGQLSLGACYWLSRIPDDRVREHYVRAACLQGLSAARSKYWYDQGVLASSAKASRGDSIVVPGAEYHVSEPLYTCVFCRGESTLDKMRSCEFHPECLDEYNKVLENSIKAVQEGEPTP